MDLRELHFRFNLNKKLDCTAFTHISIDSTHKVGEMYRLFLSGNYLGCVKIVNIKALMVQAMTDVMTLLDTGYSKKEALALIYEKEHPCYNFHIAPVYLLTFVYVNRLPKITQQ